MWEGMDLFFVGERGGVVLVTSLLVFFLEGFKTVKSEVRKAFVCVVRNVLLREMRVLILFFFSFACLGCLALARGDTETGITPPMEEWQDPGNMINYDAVSFVFLFSFH